MTSTLLKSPRINAPRVHRLASGLTIIAEQMPIEAVNLSLWIKVGSAVESDDINGMAHFLEHMIFKGTRRLACGEFERQVEERGAVINAATSQDYTYYYMTAAPRDFADLAPLQMDVVFNPLIPDDAFESERLVVLEEIRRSKDNPQRRIFGKMMATGFEQLPYRRPVLGTREIISQLQPQQMRDFHALWYQPQSVTAVAVGNLPVEELIKTVAQGFNDCSSSAVNAQFPQWHPEDRFTQVVRQEFVDDGIEEARLFMLWRVPGLVNLDDTYALDVLSAILGQGMTSRLVRDLREERQLVSSISVSNMDNLIQGLFYISARCDVGSLRVVEEGILQHLQRIQDELISQQEIQCIRTKVSNRFIFKQETPSDRASTYGYYQAIIGDLEPAFHYPDHIHCQSDLDLRQAAQEYLSPDAYGVVVVMPSS